MAAANSRQRRGAELDEPEGGAPADVLLTEIAGPLEGPPGSREVP